MYRAAPETYIFNFEKHLLRGFGHEGECIGTWIVIPGKVVSYPVRWFVPFILRPLHWSSENTEMHYNKNCVLPGQPDGKTMSLSLAPFAQCPYMWYSRLMVGGLLLAFFLGNWLLNGSQILFWHQCVFSNWPIEIIALRDIAMFHWIDLMLN